MKNALMQYRSTVWIPCEPCILHVQGVKHLTHHQGMDPATQAHLYATALHLVRNVVRRHASVSTEAEPFGFSP